MVMEGGTSYLHCMQKAINRGYFVSINTAQVLKITRLPVIKYAYGSLYYWKSGNCIFTSKQS